MTYEAQRQLQKALRSLPWYMFLVPTLVTVFISFFSAGPQSIWSDPLPEYGYWALMRIVTKLGFSYGYCDSCFVSQFSIQPMNKARTGAVESRVVALLRSLDLKPPIRP